MTGDIGLSVNEGIPLEWGAITFLDFLGWKGIWMNDYKGQSQSVEVGLTSLQSLANLIEEAETVCKEFCDNYNYKYKLISISDTIVVFSPCEKDENEVPSYKALKCHSEICSKILDMSAREGFALRGAITIGDYAYSDNLIVGPGVDECADWYNQTDWLGVIFAPSAQFIIDQFAPSEQDQQCDKTKKTSGEPTEEVPKFWTDSKIVRYPDIPVKNRVHGIKYCIDWGNDAKILNKILENTISLSRDIAIKYINTNKYLYELRPRK
jgi:hypothetical protein